MRGSRTPSCEHGRADPVHNRFSGNTRPDAQGARGNHMIEVPDL